MISKHLQNIINEKKVEMISTKYITDQDLIDLVDYLVKQKSIINSLSITESSISKKGIDYLVQTFQKNKYNLLYSDLSSNNLTDYDIENLKDLTSIRKLSLANNYLTEQSMPMLESMKIDYIDILNEEDLAKDYLPSYKKRKIDREIASSNLNIVAAWEAYKTEQGEGANIEKFIARVQEVLLEEKLIPTPITRSRPQ
jgi:hypothetical protein